MANDPPTTGDVVYETAMWGVQVGCTVGMFCLLTVNPVGACIVGAAPIVGRAMIAGIEKITK